MNAVAHRADGKVLKSDRYREPDIAAVLGLGQGQVAA